MPDFLKSLPSQNRARSRMATSNTLPPMASSLSSSSSNGGSFVGTPSASVAAAAAAAAAVGGGDNLSSQVSFGSSYCGTTTTRTKEEEVVEEELGVGENGLCGGEEAQGFFGVYDGHCGSEAVQFVRDRLHATVGEHALFVEVRVAVRVRVCNVCFYLCLW